MAYLLLDVPLCAQQKTMSCWHASARMLKNYFNLQLNWGHMGCFDADKGASPSDLSMLALLEDMKPLGTHQHQFSEHSLFSTLFMNGPIHATGHWNGVGHTVVIMGINSDDQDAVKYNDPAGGIRGSMTLDLYNQKRWRGSQFVINKSEEFVVRNHTFLDL